MSPRSVFWSSVLVLAIGSAGCQKLGERPDAAPGGVPPKSIGMADAIPLEYGDLIGLSTTETPGWALLYFQRPDKSIVAVYVNAERGMIWDKVVDIPRR